MTFEVDDEIGRQLTGLIASGRESQITFTMKAHRVLAVRVSNEWMNWTAQRRFEPNSDGPPDMALTRKHTQT